MNGSLPPADCGVTEILNRLGGVDAWEELLPLVYADLKRVAGAYLAAERPGHILQPTALVHESYLKLSKLVAVQWQNRTHFYAVAALLMRRIIVDQARRRNAEQAILTSVELNAAPAARRVDINALNDALERLARIDQRQCHIVELRFFGGMTVTEVAEVLQISDKTVKRDWAVARAWLYSELHPTSR